MLPWSSIASYSAFGIFVNYQRLYAQTSTDNGWQKLVLTAQSIAGMLIGFVYLVVCGWITAWWMPVIPLAMSVLAAIPAILIERLVGRLALGQIAVWPSQSAPA